jgi:hypothetical protein
MQCLITFALKSCNGCGCVKDARISVSALFAIKNRASDASIFGTISPN